MENTKDINIGIGFATGRKSFQRVLRTNIYTWKESGLVKDNNVNLHLIVAYDLNYQKTIATDYTKVHPDLVTQINSRTFIGTHAREREVEYLINENVLSFDEAHKVFGRGYASKRNAILYSAIKSNLDYLIFLDDDEYPLTVTKGHDTLLWGGQHVLLTHLKYIPEADITHGHHCGYISPIPYIEFNDIVTEKDFRTFVEAISNDILNWSTLKNVMKNGGVTYAKKDILTSDDYIEVQQTNGAKFISGANLCINLTNPKRVYPFYNPPGARGEDTFLSTCLSERRVLRIPVYTFHDGFSTYKNLLHGVLPLRLKFIQADNAKIVERFYKACVGWIRYKPLLLYITDPNGYAEKIKIIRKKLKKTLPKICTYFNENKFMSLLTELDKYDRSVKKHNSAFIETQEIWAKIMEHFALKRSENVEDEK